MPLRSPDLRQLRPRRVLALDLSRPVTDGPAGGVLSRWSGGGRGPALREVLAALEEAARDHRIAGLVARVDAPAGSWAHAQELRGAVAAFRASGKPAIAHAQSFSEAGDGTLAYLVATGFDEVHLQPTGEVGVTGVASVQPFVARLLDKLDVTPQFDHRHEYKAAKNLLTEERFTDAHREAADRIVASLHDQLLDAVADGRRLSRERVVELFGQAPLLGGAAEAAGLVDALAYRDQAVAVALARVGAPARLVTLSRYTATVRRRQQRPGRPRVALVHGEGMIQVGRQRRSLSGPVMGSDTVALGFEQALRDPHVRAIVFRVESPGGSAVASDAIWRAVARAREAGTPVVASMAGVAGSGGYWVAMGADHIVASGGTITGSIGVVYGKFVARALGERLGITVDEVHRGDNALKLSSVAPFTDEQWAQIGVYLDRVYDLFVERVAAGRGLDRDHVREVARGRVWTGADALDRGLVDELGGYREAFAAARRLAGLAPDARLQVRPLPRVPIGRRLGLRGGATARTRTLLAALTAAGRAVERSGTITAELPAWSEDAARGPAPW
jgi:protease IV